MFTSDDFFFNWNTKNATVAGVQLPQSYSLNQIEQQIQPIGSKKCEQ
jgi:hypothetical protein